MATAVKNNRVARPAAIEVLAGTAGTVQGKFVAIRRDMNAVLLEREDEIDIVLVAAIAKENPLLVGPPGTGKSFLVDSFLACMPGSKKFSVLFNKFSTPEEVFGPVSVKGLQQDVYRRVTTGKLPEADVAFGDEIFRANSAILNANLKILNERVFENGDGVQRKIPLTLFVSAANTWPGDDGQGVELGALFDRFLLRKWVKPISSMVNRRKLWKGRAARQATVWSTHITPAEISQAYDEAMALPWTPEAEEGFEQIYLACRAEGICPGDRRQEKSWAAVMAFAYLCGAGRVEPAHLEILAHTFWEDPQDQPMKVAKIVARIANPVGMKVNEYLAEVDELMLKVNARDLAQSEPAKVKLQEIDRKLAAITGGDQTRVVKARNYVREQIKTLLRATAASVAPLDLGDVG